jgi:maleate cis-trans isomerase
LEVLLATSEYLAQMFSNNISELHELGGIEVKIIVYLCGKAKFESEGYWRIMKEVLNICKICDNK